uniref:Vacuolar protein sorting-associated protein 13 family protein n=1 Tax=Tetraselmis sp. GSL018 TaxID=582737 RepID=A0A061SMK5_9CHLO
MRPVVEVTCAWSLRHASTLHLQYFTVLMQEVDLVLEEELLETMLYWAHSLPMEDLWQRTPGGRCAMVHEHRPSGPSLASLNLSRQSKYEDLDQVLLALGGPVAKRLSGQAQRAVGRPGTKWYFSVFHIQPIKINLTYVPGGNLIHLANAPPRLFAASRLGVQLTDISNVELCIGQLLLTNQFSNPRAFAKQIIRHLSIEALSELYKILGSVEIVGAPVSLISTLGTGVRDFFYEPARGIVHGPEVFARGVKAGTVSLLQKSAYGIFHSMGQVTGGMSKGLASLTMDKVYMQRFRRRPVSAQEGIRQGAHDLGVGFYEGFTGIVADPMRGAEAAGVKGFVKGLATGLTGVVVKPTAGMLEFASKAVAGIGGGIKSWGDEGTTAHQRFRVPRTFGLSPSPEDGWLDELSHWETILKYARHAGGRFSEDRVTDFVSVRYDRAIVFTDKRIVCLNLAKRKCLWDVEDGNILSVQSYGLSVQITSRGGAKLLGRRAGSLVKLPVRHTVFCSSRDTLQLLVEKLNRFTSPPPDPQDPTRVSIELGITQAPRSQWGPSRKSLAEEQVPTPSGVLSAANRARTMAALHGPANSPDPSGNSFTSLAPQSTPSRAGQTPAASPAPASKETMPLTRIQATSPGASVRGVSASAAKAFGPQVARHGIHGLRVETPDPAGAEPFPEGAVEHFRALKHLLSISSSGIGSMGNFHGHLLSVNVLCDAILQELEHSENSAPAAVVASLKRLSEKLISAPPRNREGFEAQLQQLSHLCNTAERLLHSTDE